MKALEITIELAQEAGHLASQFLKYPHDLEYEKTFMPFCLLSKKRYVGMLFEKDVKKGKRKEMGIVLKRRDNAPIVKDVYGGIIDILMKEKNIGMAIDYLSSHLTHLVKEECPIEKLIISKALRSDYKNPKQIAHKVLADRIGEREPGNKPKPGDRIKFVHFVNKQKTKCLQGEKIEVPEYIIANKLPINYEFYITNQLMKPIIQLYSLAIEEMLVLKGNSRIALINYKKEIEDLKREFSHDLEIYAKKREKICSYKAQKMLFEKYLTQINNESMGIKYDMTYYTENKQK